MCGQPRKLVILVVEDEATLRAYIAQYLKDAGCVVLEAGSGEGAFRLLDAKHQIDVLFTDIQLDDLLNGWDVGEAFHRTHAGCPVIYTSGNAISAARAVGNSLFFGKPYDPAEILDACHRLTAREWKADMAESRWPSRVVHGA